MKNTAFRGFCFSLIYLCIAFPQAGQAQDALPPTNIERFRTLSSTIFTKVLTDANFKDNDSILVSVGPGETSDLVTQSVTHSMIENQLKPFLHKLDSTSSMPRLSIQVLSIGVSYGPVFHQSFLGTGFSERTVDLKLAVQEIGKSGIVDFSKEFRQSKTDTVDADLIPRLEDPAFRYTHGDPPERSFYDSILAPIVILSSLGLAVYLLFTVRS